MVQDIWPVTITKFLKKKFIVSSIDRHLNCGKKAGIYLRINFTLK
jgi:hypothetical protein